MADLKLGIIVDADTRATKQEFSSLRREIKREAENMEGDWESAADSIEAALRDAGARDDLIDAARRIGREGPSEIEKMQRALRDVGDEGRTVGDALDDAADQISDSFEENSIDAEDVFGAEVRAEILSNAVESGAEIVRGLKDGFDGEDLETLVDGITDTMASIGAVGGPVGVAAGLAGGAVVQMFAGPFIAQAQEKAEQFEATFTSAFSNIVEAGAQLGRELTIAETTDELAQSTDRMAEATKTAAALELERGVVLRAMAGDQDALGIVQERYAAQTEDITGKVDDLTNATRTSTEDMVANGQAITDLEADQSALDSIVGKVTGQYENNTDALNAATEAAEAKGEADRFAAKQATDTATATARATGKAQDFTAVIDGTTRSLRAMPDGKVVEVTDDGTAKLTQKEINQIHGKDVQMNLTVDQAQAQAAADRAARAIRPPVVRMSATLGKTRAV